MASNRRPELAALRNEYELAVQKPVSPDVDVRARLSAWERVWGVGALRKAVILIGMATLWQCYALWLDNAFMVPTFTDTLRALYTYFANGELPKATLTSLRVLGIAYSIGVLAAGILTLLALTSRIGADILEMCIGMFNLLPSIALLPMALLWFGIGYGGVIFVIIYSVTWPTALNIHAGFTGVSKTLRMVGRNYELYWFSYVFKLLIPAALPNILTGLKIGWAFSWRTLIASELVFGVASGNGGIGWFIFEKKNQLEIAVVFAGLVTIIIIGLLVENIVFKLLENATIRKWGMKS
ncbi:MAG: ABC transporter permease [Desulfovibrio sp.]|jgi:NitT/TauT family transport system permease protein|nr:ABC transporter permease [Desulfovibrio sp.]